MTGSLGEQFQNRLPDLKPTDPQFATEAVDALIDSARAARASDVHLVPREDGLEMSWRIDGVLQPVTVFPRELRGNIVARLKVLSELLTYRTDVPQEGRIRQTDGEMEMRVSTFPTLFGEKCVVRMFVGSGRFRMLDDLSFPPDVLSTLRQLLGETGGVILVTGPAGSGKTTTLYACLRELSKTAGGEKSLVSLEDPIEAVLDSVAQSQVNASVGFDYETGLKSLMRQDPDVIMVGEIRDRATAEIVFQASLTGHLVLTTFHAGTAAEAIGRLLDMGVEPYQLRSGVLAVINQRLFRILCSCAVDSDDPADRMGLDVDSVSIAAGCSKCSETGYRDRRVLVEMLTPNSRETGRSILARRDAHHIEQQAIAAGMKSRWERATELVNSGVTSPAEIRRVLGFR